MTFGHSPSSQTLPESETKIGVAAGSTSTPVENDQEPAELHAAEDGHPPESLKTAEQLE
jgi:hypothetical protein